MQEDVAVLTMFTAGCPLLDIALFFEWSLRRTLSVLSLPSALVPSVVGNMLDADNAVPLHTRFANFRHWIKENPHFCAGTAQHSASLSGQQCYGRRALC